MRSFFMLFAACFSMLATTYTFAQVSSNTFQSQIRYSTANPLHYRIANVDPRLNLSKQDVIDLSKQATAIWEKDTGQKYFSYDPNAKFVINIVFDQRQVRSMKRSENLSQLEQNKKVWLNQNEQIQEFKADLTQTATQLELQKIQYQIDHENYEQQLSKLNSSKKNTAGLAKIEKLRLSLANQSVDIQKQIEEYNQKKQQLDQQMKAFDQRHQELADAVAQFNQTFKPVVLHKGQFKDNQIFIYEFSSIDDLRLTLAHEFGHALGLKHTQDPKSLMYPRIKEQDAKDFKLTDTDLKLLGFSQ
ncbi:matrixin family metalloprotease [Acinetobacter beijerinckii]|uniref:matrixin family metalloprotease n=1 Tax=Acinetobacter beijerinckii TaxID=262668 RepID=UPI004054BD58